MKPPRKGWKRVTSLVTVDVPPEDAHYYTPAGVRKEIRDLFSEWNWKVKIQRAQTPPR